MPWTEQPSESTSNRKLRLGKKKKKPEACFDRTTLKSAF